MTFNVHGRDRARSTSTCSLPKDSGKRKSHRKPGCTGLVHDALKTRTNTLDPERQIEAFSKSPLILNTQERNFLEHIATSTNFSH